MNFYIMYVSTGMALPSSSSPVVIPESRNVNHVFRVWNVPAVTQGFKSPDRGTKPILSQGPSTTSPNPQGYIRGPRELELQSESSSGPLLILLTLSTKNLQAP